MEHIDNIILITGAVGFIGAELSKKFLRKGFKVIGIDNINNYYDINLKKDRLKEIELIAKNSSSCWKFYKNSIEDLEKLSHEPQNYKEKCEEMEKRIDKLEHVLENFMKKYGPEVQEQRAKRDQVWDEMVRVVSIQNKHKGK